MNVASLELCWELYELSGWKDTAFYSIIPVTDDGKRHSREVISSDELCHSHEHEPIPLYDLGYLLRKLSFFHTELMHNTTGEYRMECWHAGREPAYTRAVADTPEDAACRLAIELIKAGVLKP